MQAAKNQYPQDARSLLEALGSSTTPGQALPSFLKKRKRKETGPPSLARGFLFSRLLFQLLPRQSRPSGAGGPEERDAKVEAVLKEPHRRPGAWRQLRGRGRAQAASAWP